MNSVWSLILPKVHRIAATPGRSLDLMGVARADRIEELQAGRLAENLG